MIYNLVAYLRIEFPGEIFYINDRLITTGNTQVPDRNVLVSETGGNRTAWFGLVRQNIQIITRDVDPPKARKLAKDIYQEIHDRWGLVLPAVTVDGDLFPAIQVNQILGVSEPQSLGADDAGKFEFTTNYVLTTRINTRG